MMGITEGIQGEKVICKCLDEKKRCMKQKQLSALVIVVFSCLEMM